MEIQNTKNLLQKVSAISKKYEEIAKVTGENFNIFKVMDMQSDEVKLHSAFIAELLNPKGTHGQEDVFLKLFVEQFKIKNFETKNATAEAEKYIGEINEAYTEGGRIDIIIIDSNNKSIIIENKIYARDQKNQLLRYYNYDTGAEIFYLTLYGEEASKNSIGESSLKKENVKQISYSNDIKIWLELCKKEAVNLPILRETITQYINIIKYLTGQTMNDKMENEIVELLSNKENFEIANEIANNINNVKADIVNVFWGELTEAIKEISKEIDKNTGLEYEEIANNKKKDDGFYFTTKENIKLFIWTYRDECLYFGIEKKQEKEIYDSLSKQNNYIDEDEMIFIPAYTEKFVLNDFTKKDTLQLFEDEKRLIIITDIVENIKIFSKKISEMK